VGGVSKLKYEQVPKYKEDKKQIRKVIFLPCPKTVKNSRDLRGGGEVEGTIK